MKKQSGFTLIELVTVIIILGILAAFAVPRFINLTSEAKGASIQGVAGSVKAASALAHSVAIIQGKTAASGETVTMENQTVDLVYGYPAATADGIGNALNLSADYGADADTSGDFIVWLKDDAAAVADAPADCQVKYAASTGAGVPPSITVADGCA